MSLFLQIKLQYRASGNRVPIRKTLFRGSKPFIKKDRGKRKRGEGVRILPDDGRLPPFFPGQKKREADDELLDAPCPDDLRDSRDERIHRRVGKRIERKRNTILRVAIRDAGPAFADVESKDLHERPVFSIWDTGTRRW